MNWLRTSIRWWKRRQERAAHEPAERPRKAGSTGPRLILLVHDASGPAAYRLHSFADAQSAEGFVEFWFPTGFEHGILTFWALDDGAAEPTSSGEEVVVLIRDTERREIVYPYSLPDMALARAWIRKEVARGLDLRLVQVHRALPVRIRRDSWGRLRLTPREPPASLRLKSASKLPEVEPRRSRRTAEPEDEWDTAELGEALRAKAQARAEGGEAPTIDEVLEEINAAELVEEIDRVIRNKRWKQQDGPFRGFDSPRGKF